LKNPKNIILRWVLDKKRSPSRAWAPEREIFVSAG
jgi:hypothetical protein